MLSILILFIVSIFRMFFFYSLLLFGCVQVRLVISPFNSFGWLILFHQPIRYTFKFFHCYLCITSFFCSRFAPLPARHCSLFSWCLMPFDLCILCYFALVALCACSNYGRCKDGNGMRHIATNLSIRNLYSWHYIKKFFANLQILLLDIYLAAFYFDSRWS